LQVAQECPRSVATAQHQRAERWCVLEATKFRMAPQSARADVGAASLWVVFGVSRETSALAFPCAILDRLMLILCPCSVAPSLPNTVPALLLVVQYYAGAISGLERLYLKPAPGTGRTDARLVVEPASPLHPATGRAASQINWAPAVLASLHLGRDWLFAGKMPRSWARCLFSIPPRWTLGCVRSSAWGLLTVPGAIHPVPTRAGAIPESRSRLTSWCVGGTPILIGTWSQVEHLAPVSTDPA